MPKRYRRFAKKRFAKRVRRSTVRKYPSRARTARVTQPMVNVRTGLGFPKRMTMTLRYADNVAITSTAGVIQTYRWSANGLYDPDITSAGHQPLYFDQVMALYNHYTVIGSIAECKIVADDLNTEPVLYTMVLNDDTTRAYSSVPAGEEQSLGKRSGMIANGSGNTYKIIRKFSAKKTYGGSILGNADLNGGSGSNPLEQAYYDLSVQSAGTTDTILWCDIRITFTAVFTELKDIASS